VCGKVLRGEEAHKEKNMNLKPEYGKSVIRKKSDCGRSLLNGNSRGGEKNGKCKAAEKEKKRKRKVYERPWGSHA